MSFKKESLFFGNNAEMFMDETIWCWGFAMKKYGKGVRIQMKEDWSWNDNCWCLVMYHSGSTTGRYHLVVILFGKLNTKLKKNGGKVIPFWFAFMLVKCVTGMIGGMRETLGGSDVFM